MSTFICMAVSIFREIVVIPRPSWKNIKTKSFRYIKIESENKKLYVGSWRLIFIPIQTNILYALQADTASRCFQPVISRFFYTMRVYQIRVCIYFYGRGRWEKRRPLVFGTEAYRNSIQRKTRMKRGSRQRRRRIDIKGPAAGPDFPPFFPPFFSRSSRRPTALLSSPAKQQPPKK